MMLYVVMGSTGEYSDHHEWMVRAFKSKEKAKDWVVKCSDKYKEVLASNKDAHFDYKVDWKNEFDPQGVWPDYSGKYYYYEEVELDESE